MKRPTRGIFGAQMRELKAALQVELTEHPVCDCGQQVPVKDWRIHRASCPMVKRPEK